MKLRLLIVTALLASACGAAADVSAPAEPLSLNDEPTTTAADVETADNAPSSSVTTAVSGPVPVESSVSAPTTTEAVGSTTTPASTAGSGPTIPTVDPHADFCLAAIDIDELGTSVDFDDTVGAAMFFDQQSERWEAATAVAPVAVSSDVTAVATFLAEFELLLVASDFDVFVVFAEVTELEASLGSDLARIRVDQFIYANCEVTPPQTEQATAAFYGGLLDTAEDRVFLAELLASAEVFPLEGAVCFVNQATADAMHPLAGAPATPEQDNALAAALAACQLSIGT